jgi:Bacterial Ig-like domain (group 3)
VATLNYAGLPVGTDSLTATYGGAAAFTGSTSNSVAQVVHAVTTATALNSSLNPSLCGRTITFTAKVTASNGLNPTGTVHLYSGTTFISDGTLSAGVATLNYAGLNAGMSSITAKYLGSGIYPASTSSAVSQVVNTATTMTALATSPNPSTQGQAVTMTATVTSPNGKIPTGTVQFFNGTAILTGINLNANGQANLSVGTHSITAKYLGNADYVTSTSSAASQVVEPS